MPNHVTTIIKPDCTVEQFNTILNSVINDAGEIDFNKIIEVDDEFSNFEPNSDVISRAKNAMGIPLADNGIIGGFERSNRIRDCFKPIDKQSIDQVIKAIRLYQKTGFFYWYEAQVDSWGTKWNAYGQNIANDYISFQTAWSIPMPVLMELSRKYPAITFDIKYADEDLGSNCGMFQLLNGVIANQNIADYASNSSGERKEWIKFAFNLLHPNDNPLDYGYDENFNYVDE